MKVPLVRSSERLWVRLSVAVVGTGGLLVGMILFPPESVAKQIYLLALIGALVAVIALISAYRHTALARAARASIGNASGEIVLFERAGLLTVGTDSSMRPLGKGWLTISGQEVAIWDLGSTTPFAVIPSRGSTAEPAGGGPFSRPVVRLQFEDGSTFEAAPVLQGFGDLRGWSRARIAALNSRLHPSMQQSG